MKNRKERKKGRKEEGREDGRKESEKAEGRKMKKFTKRVWGRKVSLVMNTIVHMCVIPKFEIKSANISHFMHYIPLI